MKQKVLIVLPSLTSGGGEKALVNMLNSFSADRYEISLQLFRNEGVNMQFVPSYVTLKEPLFPHGLPSKKYRVSYLVKHLNVKELFKDILYYLKSRNANSRERGFYEWKSILPFCPTDQDRYDIAIAAMQGVATYYVFDLVNAERKICWIHTDYSKVQQVEEEQYYFSKADSVVTVSEQCYNSFLGIYPHLKNVKMLYNLNCPELIQSMASKMDNSQCFPDQFDWHFVSVGRLIKLKGFDMLLDAAKILKDRDVSFSWYVLGEGEEKDALLNKARELQVEDRVFFAGVQANPYPYLRCADIVVQTSRYEGKSMVLDEAKILNKPIVSTKYDSVFDQINDGENGILVPISAEGIADGIFQLIGNNVLREKIIANLSHEEKKQTDLIQKYYALIEGRL